MRKRTKARECALQILYQVDITGQDFNEALSDFWATKGKFDGAVREFTRELVSLTVANLQRIDAVITGYAANWQMRRMAIVDRNILRLAACELLFMDDIPFKVTINEAVELAKKFADQESSKFVNGILDKICKEERKNAKD